MFRVKSQYMVGHINGLIVFIHKIPTLKGIKKAQQIMTASPFLQINVAV